ncbi:Protein dachsous [Schistosoma japonicum]|nr:Protein dachsous [Schistosoma japonicum]
MMHLSIWISLYDYVYRVYIFITVLTIHLDAQTTRIIRIKENTPTGTVIIPNVINFLYGQNYASVEHYDNVKDKKLDYLLAIGNSAMQGANWFAIDNLKKSLYVKIPPDRDILCPNDQILPETAVSIANGGIEFPEYNLNTGSNYNLQINNNIDNNDCIIKLSIIHGSSANPSFDMLTVVLEDINDHAPSFKEVQNNLESKTNEFVISVPETPKLIDKKDDLSSIKHRSESKPVRILLPTAVDPDQGVNSIKGYRLEGEDAFQFRLEVGPSVDRDISYQVHKEFQQVGLFQDHKINRLWLVPIGNGGSGIEAVNNGELDKEHKNEYRFVLVAYDGGSPSRMGKLPIKLIVEDVNDHSPEFNQEFYTGRMSENDPGGHIIFEFSARDRDNTKENGIVKFRIPGQAERSQSQNEGSSLTGKRDRISLSESQLIAAELFSIEYPLEKSNDLLNTQENFYNSTVYARLIIKRQPKEKIQQIAAKAIAIARQNQAVGGSKLNRNFSPQQIHTNELSSGSDQLHFFIEAYDNGPIPLVTKAPVIVLVTDVNDHPPQIFISYLKPTRPLTQINLYNTDRRQMWGKITENLDRSMIAQVTVIDKDSTFTYSDVICKTNDSRFSLEEIGNGLDRPDDPTSFWTRNNLYASSNVDPKSHLVDWHNVNKPLTKMYKLMSITSLDREFSDIQPSFLKFLIICVDNQHNELPGGSLTSQAEIFLEIEDSNDNTPVFDHIEYTFHLPENHPKIKSEHNINPSESERYTIGMVHASDKDEGIHGSVEYKLVSSPSASVQIDKFSGMLYAVQPFDREAVSELVFQVLAMDCASPNVTNDRQCDESMRLTGTANIRIIIDDLNDSPPIFQEANYHFEVEEGLDLVKVGQVLAVDADQDEAARISYRLAVGINNRIKEPINEHFSEQVAKASNNQNLYDEALEITTHFQIDPRSGLIHLKGRLDRERRAHYEFVVLALDNPRAVPTKIIGYHRQTTNEVFQFTATTTVLITVLDHNDNAPRILSPLNHVEFVLSPDQLIAGNTIFTIRATDPDLGENGTIEYRLLQVEDDLGSWNYGESAQRSSQINHENTTDTNSQMNANRQSSSEKEIIDDYPFAVDRTAGICYLRENLPPLNVDGPRAYMLRILAYDLGRPDSLNTTLIVRVARQIGANGDIANELMYSNRISAKEYRQIGRMESHQNLLPPNELDSGSDAKVGTWTSAGQARISDRTMVVILSTVFVLLLLTTIVLLLLVRYRRLLIRNIPLEQSLACDGPDSKANEGFAAGKPLSSSQNNLNGFNGFFTEVVSAPWVCGSTSPVVCPTPYNYPTIYNTGVGRSRGCIANPNACWSPTTTLCKSPLSIHENQRRLMQTPTTMCHSSPSHPFRILPTFGGGGGCVNIGNGRLFDSPVSSVNASFNGIPGGFILQNYSLRDDDEEDNRTFHNITPNNEINVKARIQNNDIKQNLQNPMSDQIFSKSLANNLHCQNKLLGNEITRSFSSLKRTAISLEELNDHKDENNSRNYSRLVRFQLAQGEMPENDPLHYIPISSKNEYQTLTSFHRDDDKYLHKTTPLLTSWLKSNHQNEPMESFSNAYDQLKCKTQLKSSLVNNNNNNNTKQIHMNTTSYNNNNNNNNNNNSIGSSNTMFPDIFQLQPLTQSQLSENHKTSSNENLCQPDDFYLSTMKSNKKLSKNNEDFIFCNKFLPKMNTTYSTIECMHNLSNSNHTTNNTTNNKNKSPTKLIEEKKHKSSLRQSKVVSLNSTKKQSSSSSSSSSPINTTTNETNNFYVEKSTTELNRPEGSFV